ncbi:pilus assembly protein TadG-related protein [Vibrio sp. 10N.261.52.C11]|uniref:TadE/TadG family type IV pilus assembly protein n=1 Tax=Vibrio sp. 10N.261.52.C11 TaxID=3229680 RepID=UPI00354E8A39
MNRHGKSQFISLQRQAGVAAVWLGLSLVPILGVTFFAVEGARYITESSRLRDSAQAAALAITIDDKAASAQEMAELYVKDYVREVRSVKVTTKRNYQAPTLENDNTEIIGYDVDATTVYDSWFALNLVPSFEDTQPLFGEAEAAKYPEYLGDKIVDVVLVTDFSGSMTRNWSQGTSSISKKIDSLKVAVDELALRILVPRAGDTIILNRLAIVPFNLRVQDKISDSLYAGSQLRYKADGSFTRTYEQVDWGYWANKSRDTVRACASDVDACPTQESWQFYEAKTVESVMSMNGRRLEIASLVDYSNSVDDMFNNKIDDAEFNFHFRSADNVLYHSGMVRTTGNGHYVLPLTSDIDEVEVVQGMNAGGNTAAYQGLIRGLQVLNDGQPDSRATPEEIEEYNGKLKIIIILSDGQEFPNNGILPNLVDNGLCDEAREHFMTENGSLFIGVIGIDFNASDQSGFQDCVIDPGSDIIDVSDREELIQRIEELIQKGSRGTGVSRLYG